MSKIEWTDETWNPVTGCTKVSPGCANCYAERMARRLAGRYGYPEAPNHFDVTLHPDKLDQPLRWKKPRMIFVCSMSDLFHEDVPIGYAKSVIVHAGGCKQHTFQFLTKRPKRMLQVTRELCNHWGLEILPLNLWLGVTAENQEQADKRIPILLQIPAAVRFVSVEPMLGAVDLPKYLTCPDCGGSGYISDYRGSGEGCGCNAGPWLDQVICGGETGPRARPTKIKWIWKLLDQCVDAGVPFFYKGAGTASVHKKYRTYRLLDGREWSEMPS